MSEETVLIAMQCCSRLQLSPVASSGQYVAGAPDAIVTFTIWAKKLGDESAYLPICSGAKR